MRKMFASALLLMTLAATYAGAIEFELYGPGDGKIYGFSQHIDTYASNIVCHASVLNPNDAGISWAQASCMWGETPPGGSWNASYAYVNNQNPPDWTHPSSCFVDFLEVAACVDQYASLAYCYASATASW